MDNKTLSQTLDANPKVDRKIVEEFERLKASLKEAQIVEEQTSYSLDMPFAINQYEQPILPQVMRKIK
jgi:hypothetical protein